MNIFPRPDSGLFYDFCTLVLRKQKIVYFLLLAMWLVGCTMPNPSPADWSFSRTDESYLVGSGETEPVGELSHGTIVSQSFMPTRDGLHRITLLMATYARSNKGQVTFILRDDAGDIVYQEPFAAADVIDNHPRLFLFPPQPDSALRLYTVQLSGDSVPGEGITLWADKKNAYPGLLHINADDLSGDLLMEWGYKPTAAVLWSNSVEGIKNHGLTMLLNLLLWTLPGLALLVWIREPEDEAWSVQQVWGAALLLSSALLVILPQYTDLVGIPLGSWAVWALLILSGACLLLARSRNRSLGPIMRPDAMTALYGLILLLVVMSRFLALHSLWGPQWGDSLHHALITQLLLDHGGIFENYNPYIPLAPFTYHAGFHLLCAWFAWAVPPGATPLSASSAILLGAQWINVMAVLMVGLLAEGLARWRVRPQLAQIAALLALLIAGLLSPMPGFYVNWGRYTQLAGQIFLPAALLWSIRSWQPDQRRRWLLLTVLVVSGLALTHYRVLIMYAVTVPLLLLFALWRSQIEWRDSLRKVAGRAIGSGLITCVLILPWYWKLIETQLLKYASYLATTGRPEGFLATYNAFGDITPYVPQWFIVLSIVTLLWLLLRRQAAGLLQGAWILLFFLLSNPYTLLGLPGTGLVNNFMLAIVLYLPLSALVGVGVADFCQFLAVKAASSSYGRGSAVRAIGVLATIVLLVLALAGTWQQIHETDPRQFSMITHSDLQAMRWIKENTPEDAIFHINGFFAFADSVVAGSDGGWWLWLTARREATAPPMIYGHESGIDPQYRDNVNARYRHLLEAYQESPESLAAAMREEKVDYVYIGAQQGRADSYPLRLRLDPISLRDSSAFESVYSDELTWIFKVR